MQFEADIPYQISPAPWQLKGEGYLMLYRFKNGFLKKEGCISEELKPFLWMNIGMVMLVNYQSSPVGPYGELLFIPGMFHYKGKYYWHISKIYVSSLDSVMNGRENWGIPKELAQFEFNNLDQAIHSAKVITNGEMVFDCHFKDKLLGFPLSTSILPFQFIQPLNAKEYVTHPNGSGKAFFSKPIELETGQGLFPSIGTQTRLACLHIPNFSLAFPNPIFL
ncbi:MAG: acetoacetate decarboxylase family protein [Sediminibacterium sp.]